MKIKICGLKEAENIAKITTLQPDYMGFVFNQNSRRFIKKLLPQSLDIIPPSITKVGVFVNDNLENILTAIRKYHFDAVQLHGSNNLELCRIIKEESKTSVIKAFPIMDSNNLLVTKEYEEVVDLFLFDTQTDVYKNPKQKFDWSIMHDYHGHTDFILSGAIGLDDVKAIQKLKHERMIGININSKFEVKPGIKDIQLIREFMKEMKKTHHQQN